MILYQLEFSVKGKVFQFFRFDLTCMSPLASCLCKTPRRENEAVLWKCLCLIARCDLGPAPENVGIAIISGIIHVLKIKCKCL